MRLASLTCPVALTSRITGGKWKGRLLWGLFRRGTLHFSELRRECPPISDRILSRELKELEGWGLIRRTTYPVVPPMTEYTLTDFGETLRPVMMAMADWGIGHRTELEGKEDRS